MADNGVAQAEHVDPTPLCQKHGANRIKVFVVAGYNGDGQVTQASKTFLEGAKVRAEAFLWKEQHHIGTAKMVPLIDSKNHGHFQWHGACVSSVVVHYRDLKPPFPLPPIRDPKAPRGQIRVKTFIAGGANDGTGNPTAAEATMKTVSDEYEDWTRAHSTEIEVVNHKVVIDAKVHGRRDSCGACVSWIAVEYSDVLAAAQAIGGENQANAGENQVNADENQADAADPQPVPRPLKNGFLGRLSIKVFAATGYAEDVNPVQAVATLKSVQDQLDTWQLQNYHCVRIDGITVHVDSKQHGNADWHAACISYIVVKYRPIRDKPLPEPTKNNMKLWMLESFVAMGCNDDANPTQAMTTTQHVMEQYDKWLQEHEEVVDVQDLDFVLDSRNHGADGSNGACVTALHVQHFAVSL